MGKKETLKCIPALNDRDERPSCLFGASAKSALDFFLDHSLPRMQSCSYWNYQVSMRFCSWLKASSIRGLNSILPLQISIINHVIFFPSLQFPNNICMSTETVAVHNERSDTFNGTVHYGEEPRVNADCLWSSALGDYDDSWSEANYRNRMWDLFDTFPRVCVTRFNQCRACGNIIQWNEIPPWW